LLGLERRKRVPKRAARLQLQRLIRRLDILAPSCRFGLAGVARQASVSGESKQDQEGPSQT